MQIIEIEDFKLEFFGNNPAFVVLHKDRSGIIYSVTKIIAEHKINISHMEFFRKENSDLAIMRVETDEDITPNILDQIREEKDVITVLGINICDKFE